jgi:hypothetical protein
MEQTTSHLLDLMDQISPNNHHSDFSDEEPLPWEAAWIDIGGEG